MGTVWSFTCRAIHELKVEPFDGREQRRTIDKFVSKVLNKTKHQELSTVYLVEIANNCITGKAGA